MKILFVCSANKVRSVTAEYLFSEKYPHHEFDSAGTNHTECFKEGSTPLEEEHLIWADLVIVMEGKHRQIIRKHTKGKYGYKIKTLGIRDIYKKRFDSQLIKILLEKGDKFMNIETPDKKKKKEKKFYPNLAAVYRPDLTNMRSRIRTIYLDDMVIDGAELQEAFTVESSVSIRPDVTFDFKINYDEKILEKLIGFFHLVDDYPSKINLSIILDNGSSIISKGYITQIGQYEDYISISFTPDHYTNLMV